MAVERRDPLPVGRYWVTIFDGDRQEWDTWLQAYPGQVVVEQSETNQRSDGTGYSIVIFHTTAPVHWVGLGFPTIAGSDIRSPRDTYTAPTIDTSLKGGVQMVYGPVVDLAAKPANAALNAIIPLAIGGIVIYALIRNLS